MIAIAYAWKSRMDDSCSFLFQKLYVEPATLSDMFHSDAGYFPTILWINRWCFRKPEVLVLQGKDPTSWSLLYSEVLKGIIEDPYLWHTSAESNVICRRLVNQTVSCFLRGSFFSSATSFSLAVLDLVLGLKKRLHLNESWICGLYFILITLTSANILQPHRQWEASGTWQFTSLMPGVGSMTAAHTQRRVAL